MANATVEDKMKWICDKREWLSEQNQALVGLVYPLTYKHWMFLSKQNSGNVKHNKKWEMKWSQFVLKFRKNVVLHCFKWRLKMKKNS